MQVRAAWAVEEGDRQWERALARRGVSAGPNVQRALAAFGVARGNAVTAINGQNEQEISSALAEVEHVGRDVFRMIKVDQDAANEDLAPLLLSRPAYCWRRLLRKRLLLTPIEWIEDDS